MEPMTKVLVVDDERALADTLVTILKRAGFDASAVYSGAQAINVAPAMNPSLIISDVAMPEMNGVEAMIVIRGILPDCKILLFSGNALAFDLLKDARTRGYDFEVLPKPLHPMELINRLTEL
jgi:CheY-like chemotaxis protein